MKRWLLAAALIVLATVSTVDPLVLRPELHDLALTQAAVLVLASVPVVILTDHRRAATVLARSVGGRWWAAVLLWMTLSGAVSDRPAVGVATAAAFVAASSGVLDLARRSTPHAQAALAGVVVSTFVLSWPLAAVARISLDADLIRDSRLALLSIEPNHLARVAALAFVAAAGTMWNRNQRLHLRILWGGIAAVAALTVAATDSRTALVAACVGFAVAATAQSGWRIGAGFVGLGLMATGILAAGGWIGSAADGLRRSSDDPLGQLAVANGRTTLWTPVIEQIRSKPLFGTGPGLEREAIIQLHTDGVMPWRPDHAHNLLLHVGLVAGLIGLGLLLIALVAGWSNRSVRDFGVLAGLTVAVLIDGISEAAIATPGPAWIVLVMAAAWSVPPPSTALESPESQRFRVPMTRLTSSSISSTASL